MGRDGALMGVELLSAGCVAIPAVGSLEWDALMYKLIGASGAAWRVSLARSAWGECGCCCWVGWCGSRWEGPLMGGHESEGPIVHRV